MILEIKLCKKFSDEEQPKLMRFKLNKASEVFARKEKNHKELNCLMK